jgi:SAM-dependent methyltransferase
MDYKYQENYYHNFRRIQDKEKRLNKSEKIISIISTYYQGDFSNLKCLDVGCSAGYITCELAKYISFTCGIEYDKEALDIINSNCLARFVCGDAMNLPFAGGFDLVICAQVYEHVPSADRLIQEIHRVLDTDGLVFFSGPNWSYPIEPHYFLPFLHWFPKPIAGWYLRLFNKGDSYYETLLTWKKIKALLSKFEILDGTYGILVNNISKKLPPWIYKNRLFIKVLKMLICACYPMLPNYNLLLKKRIG